jgi:hypothetical protein
MSGLYITSLRRLADIFQVSLAIALAQFIEQPQHTLDQPRMWSDFERRAEGSMASFVRATHASPRPIQIANPHNTRSFASSAPD